MLRNSHNFILIGLVCVLCIISYNYWSLSQRNNALHDALFRNEANMNELEEKKLSVEKQNGVNLDRIKFFEERMSANSQAIKQKDKEIDELNSKLKTVNQDYNDLLLDFNEAKDRLAACNKEKSIQSDNLLAENNELKMNYTSLVSQLNKQKSESDCANYSSSKLNEFKKDLIELVGKNFEQSQVAKFAALIDRDFVNSATNLTHSILNDEASKRESALITDNVCTLPKLNGDCKNATDRYYYDAQEQKCLIFVFGGCNGNANNFKTLDECEEKCVAKNDAPSILTPTMSSSSSDFDFSTSQSSPNSKPSTSSKIGVVDLNELGLDLDNIRN